MYMYLFTIRVMHVCSVTGDIDKSLTVVEDILDKQTVLGVKLA